MPYAYSSRNSGRDPYSGMNDSARNPLSGFYLSPGSKSIINNDVEKWINLHFIEICYFNPGTEVDKKAD